MRILHVIASLDPASGGPPVVATRLAAGQAQLGAHVEVLSYAAPLASSRIREFVNAIRERGDVKYHFLPPVTRLENLAAVEAGKWAGGNIERFDWVHLHGVWERILPKVAAAAHDAGKDYAIVPHGMLDPWSLQQAALKKKVALILGYRKMLERATFIHVLNTDEGRLLKPLQLSSPTVNVPNGIFLEELDDLPPAGTFFQARPELQGKPYIFFLSRLHHKKGPDFLVEAFAKVAATRHDTHLVVAGPDYGALGDFEARVAAAGLKTHVHVVGSLFGREKLAAFVDASCFCLPSRQEGFSIAILEALGCGVPAVVSEECHFPEIGEVNAGAVVPLDPVKIANALLHILNDTDLRSEMSKNGRELVRTRYTWPAIAKQTLDIYEKMARRGQGLTLSTRSTEHAQLPE